MEHNVKQATLEHNLNNAIFTIFLKSNIYLAIVLNEAE